MAGKRPSFITREYLENAALPQHANSYACIPHKFIIDHVHATLKANNLEVDTEMYKCNQHAEIATGTYYLKSTIDPELGMVFAWANSYDKTMRFKCSIGAKVYLNDNVIIGGDVASWGRVHKGTALTDTQGTIDYQIQNASKYFHDLINDKEAMKKISLSKEEQASLLGLIWANKELITIEQAGIAVKQMKKPDFDYGDVNTLWAFYNHVLAAVKTSHPKRWLDRQRSLHYFICCQFKIGNYCNIITSAPIQRSASVSTDLTLESEPQLLLDDEPTDPNQLNLLDAIAKAEKESGIQDPHVLIRNMDGEPLAISKFEDGVEEEEITLDEPKICSDFDIDNTDDLTLDEQDNKVIEPVLESVPTVVPTIISEVPHSSKEENLELTAEQQAALDALNDDEDDLFNL